MRSGSGSMGVYRPGCTVTTSGSAYGGAPGWGDLGQTRDEEQGHPAARGWCSAGRCRAPLVYCSTCVGDS